MRLLLLLSFLSVEGILASAPSPGQPQRQSPSAQGSAPVPNVTMSWNCSLVNVMECFSQLAQAINSNIQSAQCQGRSAMAPTGDQYRQMLRSTLMSSMPASLTCQNARWTEAMTVAANIVLGRSQACQLDHSTLLLLGQAVNRIFAVQKTCQLDDATAYEAKLGLTLHSLLSTQSNATTGQPQASNRS